MKRYRILRLEGVGGGGNRKKAMWVRSEFEAQGVVLMTLICFTRSILIDQML